MLDQKRSRLAKYLVQAERKRFGHAVATQIGQVPMQHFGMVCRRVQQEVGPCPGLGVVVLRHVERRVELLEASQVGPPLALPESGRQQAEVPAIHAVSTTGNLAVFGQPFVEPERKIRHHRV